MIEIAAENYVEAEDDKTSETEEIIDLTDEDEDDKLTDIVEDEYDKLTDIVENEGGKIKEIVDEIIDLTVEKIDETEEENIETIDTNNDQAMHSCCSPDYRPDEKTTTSKIEILNMQIFPPSRPFAEIIKLTINTAIYMSGAQLIFKFFISTGLPRFSKSIECKS